MQRIFNIAAGWTGRLSHFLITAKLAGATAYTPFSLSGYTVKLGWRVDGGDWAEAPGTVTVASNQTTNPGEFDYTPASASDFIVSNGTNSQEYYVRADIIDGTGKIVNAPSGLVAIITVHKK